MAVFDAHSAGYKPEQAPGLNARLLDRLSAIPGIRSAALSGLPPVSFGNWVSDLKIPGYTPAPKEDTTSALNRVSGEYFETTGIAMVAGRPIRPSDTAASQQVVVINEEVAKHFFPKGDAIGRMLTVNLDSLGGARQIVGIARNTKFGDPHAEAQRMVYIPLAQIVDKNGAGNNDSFANYILLRTVGDPAQAISALRGAVAEVDPNLPLQNVRTISEHLDSFLSTDTLISRLTIVFALLALLLACIGLYGVLNYSVVRRSSEIGIRIALGASPGNVQWMVLRESLVLFAVGVALGLPAALALARLVRSQLFEVSPFDPMVFVSTVVGIGVVALFSAWLPARRAASVDPMTAVRCE
jgi:predicted permease